MKTNLKYDPDGQLSLGQTATDFNLPGVDGKNYRLLDCLGKAKGVAVIFSCNHCPMVIKYEERMIELGKAYQPKEIAFFLISVNDVVKYPMDNFTEMKKRAIAKGYPFPYLFDESQASAHEYGAQTTPHVFLFNSEMKLCYRGAVDDNPDKLPRETIHYLKDAIECLMAGNPEEILNAVTQPVGCSIKWK
jgi:peroxiredoxin